MFGCESEFVFIDFLSITINKDIGEAIKADLLNFFVLGPTY